MMIKKINAFYAPLKIIGATCLSMLFIISACKKDPPKTVEPPYQISFELKNWFINMKTQLAGKELLQGFNPIWDKVNIAENNKEFIYEVNLENTKNIFTARKEIDTKDAVQYHKLSLFKLVIIKDKSNNSIKAAYMNIISEDNNQILSNIHYKQIVDFTGVVQYYNLDGTYNTGWHYSKGKLDIEFNYIEQTNSKPTTENVCGSQPIYQTICAGPNSDTHGCYTTQIGGGYYQCDKSLNPDTGGGGGFTDGNGGIGIGRKPAPTENKFKMTLADQEKYKKLTKVVKNIQKYVATNENVLKALMKFTGFDKTKLLDELKFGKGPSLIITEQKDSYGYHNPLTNTVEINQDYANKLENSSDSDGEILSLFLSVVMLHEFVHWTDGLFFNYTQERGAEWEKSAYGFVVYPDNVIKLIKK